MIIPIAGSLNYVQQQVIDFAAPSHHEHIRQLFHDSRFMHVAELVMAGAIHRDPRHLPKIPDGLSDAEATAISDKDKADERATRIWLDALLGMLTFKYALSQVLVVFDQACETFPILPEG